MRVTCKPFAGKNTLLRKKVFSKANLMILEVNIHVSSILISVHISNHSVTVCNIQIVIRILYQF